MEWSRAIDGYCERLSPEYWAEPVNALTNLAFLVAAALMAWRLRGARLPLAWALVAILALIGVGSFLFHTHGQVWSALADVVPIGGFVLLYIFVANRAYWGMRFWPALGGTMLFLPFAALTVPLFRMVPGLGSSAGYAPVALLIFLYAFALRHRLPAVARGLALGAALLCLSLLMRSLDMPLCARLPLGTHFLWHLLNAAMLGWMIEVYRRHMQGRVPASSC